jgi:hypothetical protein
VLAVGAACSLGDFTGYSNGDSPADGGPVDAPPTSTSPDGGDSSTTTVDDGGRDGNAEGGAKFCEVNGDAGFFCEDFEGPNPLTRFETTKQVGGTLTVDNGALIADVPPGAAEASAYGVMPAKTSASSARISFRVEAKVLNTTKANACQMAKIYFFGPPGSAPYEVGVGIKGATSSSLYTYEYTEGGGYKEFGDLPPLAANAMTLLVLEARIDASAGPRLNLHRDGVRVVADKVLTPPRNAGVVEGFVGLPYVPVDHGAWQLRLDDILMGLLP